MVVDNESILQELLAIAAQCFKIFPVHSFQEGACTCDNPKCKSPAKHPMTFNGVKDASCDPETIRDWLEQTKGLCNWGLATGNRFGVMDCEAGDVALDSILKLVLSDCLGQGLFNEESPEVRSGGGGKHYYYSLPEGVSIGNLVQFRPKIDWRGDNGYVLIPPSNHKSGNLYSWDTPLTHKMTMIPNCLLAILQRKQVEATPQVIEKIVVPVQAPIRTPITMNGMRLRLSNGTPDLTNSEGAGQGKSESKRNPVLCKLIGVHLARGEDVEDIKKLALAWALTCVPPIDEAKVLTTVEALYKKDQQTITISPDASNSQTLGNYLREGFISEPSVEEKIVPSERKFPNANRLGTFSEPEAKEDNSFQEKVPSVETSEDEESYMPVEPETLNPKAFHGLLGKIVQVITPETEADPIGVLVSLLTAVGNSIGNKACFRVGPEEHHTNLFTCLVGDTSSGKGQSLALVTRLMKEADSEWASNCIVQGLSSGEGLVDRLKDEEFEPEIEQGNVKGFKASSSGVSDKRLLCTESEFMRVITAMRREGNTLSPILRSAWDSQTLEVLTRGKSKLRASGTHISIIAHITLEELDKCLSKGVEVYNGFANRFLWCEVHRSRLLPHGGNIEVLSPYIEPLKLAILKAKTLGVLRRSPDADSLWESVYAELVESHSGTYGRVIERARPQVMRLALIYALMDGSSVIDKVHLEAGLAVWDYCKASAKAIFSRFNSQTHPSINEPEALPLAARLLAAITNAPGISRTELLRAFRCDADALTGALDWLEDQGQAHCQREEGKTKPSECWHPGVRNYLLEGFISEPEAEEDSSDVSTVGNYLPEGTISDAPKQKDNSFQEKVPTLPELIEQVRAIGGRFQETGECVLPVESQGSLSEEMLAAIEHYQTEIRAFF